MIQFFAGLASGMILLLVTQRIVNAYRKQDDRTSVIKDVAQQYHAAREDNALFLLECGICRLNSTDEIEAAIQEIKGLGHRDPLRPFRDDLSGKDLVDFYQILYEDKNPLLSKDIKAAVSKARQL